MRLSNGFVIDKEKTFGELKFTAVRDVFLQNEDGTPSTQLKKRAQIMNNTDVPIWEKYTLTIEEASKYFRIGEKKLRKLAEENIDAGWVIVNGNRIQIKRKQFEKIIDTLDEI